MRSLFLLLLGSPLVLCAPLFGLDLGSLFDDDSNNATSDATPTPVSASTVNDQLVRPALFAQLAYCDTELVDNRTNLDTIVPGMKVLQSGGNDGTIPLYYIAYDPTGDSVVLAHQGTDAQNILSLANDVQFLLTPLNSSRFPSAPTSPAPKVHDGFQKTFERTADDILSGMQKALAETGASNILVAGHSLGAAVAVMGAMMLQTSLNSSVPITTTVFGLPRTGDQAWATFVDNTLAANLTHVTNQHDPVPIVPPRLFSYVQPVGEVHIAGTPDANGNPTDVVACSGQENSNCAEGNSLLQASVANHIGPYFNNISMSHSHCPLSFDNSTSNSTSNSTARRGMLTQRRTTKLF